MFFSKRHSVYRTLLSITMLFGLLLQVEPAFACQMEEKAGPAKECCCIDNTTAPNPDSDPAVDQNPCCDFSLELSFKNSQNGSSAPLLISTRSDHSPPVQAISGYVPVGSGPDAGRMPAWRRDFDPAHSGTHTYLTTLRLRI